MKLRSAAALAALTLCAGPPAGAQNYVVKDATGATQSMASKLNGGVNFPEHVVTDASGANALVVTAGGAALVDGSATTQPVSGAVSIAGTLPGFTTAPSVRLDQTGANNGVQVVNTVAVSGSFWQATQPISAAALPLPAGAALESGGNLAASAANTAANGVDLGAPGASACATDTGACSLNALLQRLAQRLTSLNTTLGSPFQAGGSIGNTGFAASQSGAWTVQPGNTANTTPWLTTDSADAAVGAGTAPAKAGVAGLVFNSSPPSLTTGQSAALQGDSGGDLMVNLKTAIPAGANLIGKVGIDQTTPGATNAVALAQVGATSVATGNGTSSAGDLRVNIASDNTAFTVNAAESGTWTVQPGNTANTTPWLINAQPAPATSGGLSKCFLVAAATTNATNCKASAGQVYHISAFNNSASVAWLHMVNSASAPTCSSATTVDELMVPANGGVEREVTEGDAYSTGISFCLSGGIAANDNTAVAASTFTVTVFYK